MLCVKVKQGKARRTYNEAGQVLTPRQARSEGPAWLCVRPERRCRGRGKVGQAGKSRKGREGNAAGQVLRSRQGRAVPASRQDVAGQSRTARRGRAG